MVNRICMALVIGSGAYWAWNLLSWYKAGLPL